MHKAGDLHKCRICGGTSLIRYDFNRKYGATYWKCTLCKTIVLDSTHWPRNIRDHYNAYYNKDFQGRGLELKHFYKRAQIILPYLAQGAKVFEVGAASGESLHVLESYGYRVYGSELSSHAVQLAKKNYGITLINGTIFDAQLPPASQDAVIMYHVLEHIEDPKTLLEEIYRVLKPSGILVIEVPNPSGIDARVSRALRESILDYPHHLFAFPIASLTGLLTRMYFGILKIERSPSYLMSSHLLKWFRFVRPASLQSIEKQSAKKQKALETKLELQNMWRLRIRSLCGRIAPGMAYTIVTKKNT